MIELKNDELVFSFPEVHPAARMTVTFQRTLRIPDDDRDYPLPPGLGEFPLRHVDDFPGKVPNPWIEHGGVMLPMYQSEAMWLSFSSDCDPERDVDYPFAVKIATGKVSAVSGETWKTGLNRRPQDYLVVPEQPWIDGYCVQKGIIRQFVAMPLGSGYTAEEQVTGEAEHGGLQIMVYPMDVEAFKKRFPKIPDRTPDMQYCMADSMVMECASPDMGLAPGGRMRQEIYRDPYRLKEWDQAHSSRCFVHIANSLVWRAMTGRNPPTVPPTSSEYTNAGLPWFEWYDDANTAVSGSKILSGMKSVAQLGQEKGDVPLPENQAVTPEQIVELRRGLKRGQVREF